MSNAQHIISLLEKAIKPTRRNLRESDDYEFSISGLNQKELYTDLSKQSKNLSLDQKEIAETILDVATEIFWATSEKDNRWRSHTYDGNENPFCTEFLGADIDFVSLDRENPSFEIRAAFVVDSEPSEDDILSLKDEISDYSFDGEEITSSQFEFAISKRGQFNSEWENLKESKACRCVELLNEYIEDYIHQHNLSFGEGEFEFTSPKRSNDGDYVTNFNYISY